jgi:hypothetical protein
MGQGNRVSKPCFHSGLFHRGQAGGWMRPTVCTASHHSSRTASQSVTRDELSQDQQHRKRDTKKSPRRQEAGMALPLPNSAHRDKPTSAKCPRYRAVLSDIRLLTRETDSTGWGGLDRPSLRALLTLTDLHSHTLTFRPLNRPRSSVVAWTKTSFPPPSWPTKPNPLLIKSLRRPTELQIPPSRRRIGARSPCPRARGLCARQSFRSDRD